AFGDNVTATVTSDGKIQVQDDRTGDSSVSLSLSYGGGGSLTFDTMNETTTGRYAMLITASKSASNELVLTHDRYGSESFTITADAEYGITDGTYSGQDVAGTINGESATGNGQSLKADDGTTAEGLRINYTGSATGVVGNVIVSYGVAESMYQKLDGLIDPFDGYVSNKIDSLQDRVQEFDNRIEKKEDQIELKRQYLFNQFVSMEMAISRMQAESNWLNSQLGGLSQFL
ncbi:MAG TPA: flagellar filament capping protein FliD, partial [bacterium]|nr:flagellar filament capping protein FliD [bacterium]